MTLRIEGSTTHPTTFTAADLARLPGQIADVSAIVPGRRGAAVALRSVLDAAGIAPEATHLTVEAGDGFFSASVPLDAVGDAVLVPSLHGAPLPRAPGGPLRLLIPDAARCGRDDVDRCANVKDVVVLRLGAGPGRDTRPTTTEAHRALHRHEGDGGG
jgi:hypothetical protein